MPETETAAGTADELNDALGALVRMPPDKLVMLADGIHRAAWNSSAKIPRPEAATLCRMLRQLAKQHE